VGGTGGTHMQEFRLGDTIEVIAPSDYYDAQVWTMLLVLVLVLVLLLFLTPLLLLLLLLLLVLTTTTRRGATRPVTRAQWRCGSARCV